jgi:signal transduction histidine kinase
MPTFVSRAEPTDLSTLTYELASTYRPAIERAGLDLVIEAAPLPGLVAVDRAMWAQIVHHLLANALKFTAHGRIRVTLRRTDDVVELAVRDTGCGIRADHSLARELARAHGGTIDVETEHGSGTTFIVRLPAGAEPLPADPAPRVFESDAQIELAAAKRDAELAHAELEKTVQYMDHFIAILGHDLRNPLNSISTAAQLLERRATTPDIARPASRVVLSADRMTRMINQLLDLTRVRVAGGLRLDPKMIDVGELCQLVADELRQGHTDAKIELSAHGSLMGRWDGTRLSQVLSNVVGNAVDHGELRAPIRVQLDGSAPEQVEIRIENRGLIPDDVLATLFDPFRGTHRRDNTRGLGLGLYISREIVHAHRGTIEVRSNRDEGTSVAIHLPKTSEVAT